MKVLMTSQRPSRAEWGLLQARFTDCGPGVKQALDYSGSAGRCRGRSLAGPPAWSTAGRRQASVLDGWGAEPARRRSSGRCRAGRSPPLTCIYDHRLAFWACQRRRLTVIVTGYRRPLAPDTPRS